MEHCLICGEKTQNQHVFCKKHSDMDSVGEIDYCPKCDKWFEKKQGCSCGYPKQKKQQKRQNSEELTCILCGKPSNGKHFCYDCWKQYKKETFFLEVNNCTHFEKVELEAKLREQPNSDDIFCTLPFDSIEISDVHKCLICGEETSNDNYLCKECYYEHKGEIISAKIKNPIVFNVEGKTIERKIIEDKHDNLRLRTAIGIYVRSEKERAIADYLTNKRVWFTYEKPVPYDDNKEPLKPDFYLLDYDIYIEYWGMDTPEYNKQKEYKKRIYKKLGITVIDITAEDMDNPEVTFSKIFYKHNIISRNF